MPKKTFVDMPKTSLMQTYDTRDKALISALDAVLPELLTLHNVPGLNIALARCGEIVWEGAYGYADATRRVPMTPKTVFRSGSMGKTYTAGAVMQLIEQGVLTLEDAINDHLPFKVQNLLGGPEITIFHLLTHTSGLGGDSASGVFNRPRPLDEAVLANLSSDDQSYGDGVPTWAVPAGQRGIYSNLAIATLGLIVQLTNPEGLSFSEYVEQNIMTPLGMVSTRYPPAQSEEYIPSEIWKKMSTGYNLMGGVWIPTPLVYFEEFPAGGFISTPGEHIKYILATMNGGVLNGVRIFREETVCQMLTPQRAGTIEWLNPRERQGLVWRLRDWDAPSRAFWHTGAHMFGWRTNGIAWPEHETAVVYACNTWGVLGGMRLPGIDTFIESWLLAEPSPALSVPEGIDNLAWKASYLRGLLFVEGYRYSIGIPDKLDMAEVERLASDAVSETWLLNDSLWEPEAFVRGVSDMNEIPQTSRDIHDFAISGRIQITLDEARRIYSYLATNTAEESRANLAGLMETPT